MSNEVVLFNFDDNTAVSAWIVVNDTVMGGVSSSRMETSEDGTAVFVGNVSLKNRGGFASVRGPRIIQSLGKFEGISIRVKGDGKRYNCGLRTDDSFDGVFHRAPFETKSGEWQLVKIPFTDFVPTYHGRRLPEDKRMKPEDIGSVSFLIADKQKGLFRLEIDWIKAYR
jgi:monofunctional biosynthetic peptidoglycan transglycosylase